MDGSKIKIKLNVCKQFSGGTTPILGLNKLLAMTNESLIALIVSDPSCPRSHADGVSKGSQADHYTIPPLNATGLSTSLPV